MDGKNRTMAIKVLRGYFSKYFFILFLFTSCDDNDIIEREELMGKYILVGSKAKPRNMYIDSQGYKIVSGGEIVSEGGWRYTVDGFYEFEGYADIKPDIVRGKIILPLESDIFFPFTNGSLYYEKVSDEEYIYW